MVAQLLNNFCLFAQQATAPEKLPPPLRAKVYMALLGILLIGLLLIVIVLLGGHWVRRLGSYRRGPAVPADFRVGAQMPKKETAQNHSRSQDDDRSYSDTISPDDTIVS